MNTILFRWVCNRKVWNKFVPSTLQGQQPPQQPGYTGQAQPGQQPPPQQYYNQQPQQQMQQPPVAPPGGANPYSRGPSYGQYPRPQGQYPQTYQQPQ